jgi:hypothetical protein
MKPKVAITKSAALAIPMDAIRKAVASTQQELDRRLIEIRSKINGNSRLVPSVLCYYTHPNGVQFGVIMQHHPSEVRLGFVGLREQAENQMLEAYRKDGKVIDITESPSVVW